MAVDGYMFFKPYGSDYLVSESQVELSKGTSDLDKFMNQAGANGLFEIEDFSFDIEQTLNIGSQSTGAGAGKVIFNPFSIKRKIDVASPVLFQNACSGTPFEHVGLGLRKATGGPTSGQIYLVFNFKLVAVKTVAWTYDDGSPKEAVTFEYGGLQVRYSQQQPNGALKPPILAGWNRVKNIRDLSDDPIR